MNTKGLLSNAIRTFLITIVLLCGIAPIYSQNFNSVDKKIVVVLDPGHGGKDPGTLGTGKNGVREKDIVLEIATILGKLIRVNLPNIEVVFTRKTDIFVDLQERANMANHVHADLFISLHCNAAESPSAYGTTTYILGLHKSEENLAVAKRENAVMMLEVDYRTKYKGFDPNSVEDIIAMTLQQSEHLESSITFSDIVQRKFEHYNRKNRGVRQAGFWVLHQTAMPGALIELGFMSNNKEEKFLASQKGKLQIANALLDALKEYLETTYPAQKALKNLTAKSKVDIKELEVKSAKINKKPAKRYVPPVQKNNLSSAYATKENSVVTEIPNTTTKKASPKRVEIKEKVPLISVAGNRITYRIQLFALSKELGAKDPSFRGLSPINYYRVGDFYKYTYGVFDSYEEAYAQIPNVKGLGFTGVFVVTFEGNNRK